MANHELHIEVGKAFDLLASAYNLKVLKDDACYDPALHMPHLQFFLAQEANRKTCVSYADIIILKGDEVKLVCEIEESGFNPTKIFGKLFSNATANKIKVRDTNNNLSLSSDGIFVQIISSEKMNASMKNALNSGKNEQLKFIEFEINSILKTADLWIKNYYILCGSPQDLIDQKSIYNDLENIIKHLK